MKQIAIDGLAGSGKGTVAKIISERCNLTYIDSGITYRCIALAMIDNDIDISEEDRIVKLTKKLNIEFTNEGKIYLNGKDVTDKIRSKEVNELVYKVSQIIKVRELMVQLLKKLAENKDVIMEGRDITTVVLPNADYKFYLDASLDVRAKRRFIQNKGKNINMSLEEIKKSIKNRDNSDMNKDFGVLKHTEEQIYIDTTNMTTEEVVEKIIKIIGE